MMRCGLALLVSCGGLLAASAEETKLFRSPGGDYEFRYPNEFWIDTEFADGSGKPVGITASTVQNGDTMINFHAMPVRAVTMVAADTAQAYVDQYIRDFKVMPRVKFMSWAMTSLLGRPAVDMRFDERIVGRNRLRRVIATVVGGKDYFLMCLYRHDRADKFSPACEMVAASVRLSGTP
ncbi:hypothetical protein [Labrys neptuniae]